MAVVGMISMPAEQLEGFHTYVRRFLGDAIDIRIENYMSSSQRAGVSFPQELDQKVRQAYLDFTARERNLARLLAAARKFHLA